MKISKTLSENKVPILIVSNIVLIILNVVLLCMYLFFSNPKVIQPEDQAKDVVENTVEDIVDTVEDIKEIQEETNKLTEKISDLVNVGNTSDRLKFLETEGIIAERKIKTN